MNAIADISNKSIEASQLRITEIMRRTKKERQEEEEEKWWGGESRGKEVEVKKEPRLKGKHPMPGVDVMRISG